MSEYIVTEAFKDKFTDIHYPKGAFYPCKDADRVEFLQENGYIGEEVNSDPEEESDERIVNLGGGYYELPNGEKVRGKKKALEKLNELDETPPEE